MFISVEPEGRWAAVKRAALEALVTTAFADVEGVTVSIPALGLDAVTDGDGTFTFTDVPAGTFDITFTLGDTSVALSVDVPENAVIILKNVNVNDDDEVDIDEVVVKVKDEDSLSEDSEDSLSEDDSEDSLSEDDSESSGDDDDDDDDE